MIWKSNGKCDRYVRGMGLGIFQWGTVTQELRIKAIAQMSECDN